MIKTDPKPQITSSMLGMFERCGYQWLYRYGAKFGLAESERILPPGVAAVVGTAVHKGVEVNLRHKMEKGVLAPIDVVFDAGRDSIVTTFQAGEVMLTEDGATDPAKVQGEAIDSVISLSRLHHAEVAPKIEPAALEEPFVIQIQGSEYDLAGRKDIREKNGVIRDTKTKKTSPSASDGWTMQTRMYALSEKIERGALPPRIALDYLVNTKTPKLVQLVTEAKDMALAPLLERLNNMANVIEVSQYVRSRGNEDLPLTPADPNSWICTSKWCGYAFEGGCPYWSGRRE